jgi:DNA polymerase
LTRTKCTLDYETRSEANLKVTGGVKYAQDPSTEILCAGYKIGKAKTKLWVPFEDPMPSDLKAAMNDDEVDFVAHNALFEQCITEFVLRREEKVKHMPPTRWTCTAAKAAACALPRSLDGVGQALKLPILKNTRASRIVKKYMKPRPAWVKTGKGDKYFSKPEELQELFDYCITDVDVEVLVDETLPDLIPAEREVWLMNMEMNLRGLQVDNETVRKILRMIAEESKELEAEALRITGGINVSQRDAVLNWINKNGKKLPKRFHMPNLQADTVTKAITMLPPGPIRKVLRIRQAVSKTSTKKYHAMRARSNEAGRVCDLAMYHGASTGREAGTGIQVHNFPKGSIKDIYEAIEVVKTSDRDFIKLVYGDLFNVFSSICRGMITATEGYSIYAADFNAIEARMLHWFADHKPGLEAWAKGVDQYKKMATVIFGVALPKVDDDQRFVGKQAVLGCGYGMGDRKFLIQCAKFGKDVDPKVAKKAVEAYRETHPKVVQMWYNFERAAIKAVMTGKVIKVNRTAWWVEDNFLWCRLPSGRSLAFYGPTVRNEKTPWGELAPKLYHWGVDSYTKKWVNSATYGGKLTENVIQAAARDITMAAAVRAKRKGYLYLFQVHDELICEHQRGDLSEYEKILTTLPPWADGLPLAAKGWNGPRYKKG